MGWAKPSYMARAHLVGLRSAQKGLAAICPTHMIFFKKGVWVGPGPAITGWAKMVQPKTIEMAFCHLHAKGILHANGCQEGFEVKKKGRATLLGWRWRVIEGVLGGAGKIVHGGWRWWCRRRWIKRGGKYGRCRRRKNLGKKWFFANFVH